MLSITGIIRTGIQESSLGTESYAVAVAAEPGRREVAAFVRNQAS